MARERVRAALRDVPVRRPVRVHRGHDGRDALPMAVVSMSWVGPEADVVPDAKARRTGEEVDGDPVRILASLGQPRAIAR